jgi:hypothetical protein
VHLASLETVQPQVQTQNAFRTSILALAVISAMVPLQQDKELGASMTSPIVMQVISMMVLI